MSSERVKGLMASLESGTRIVHTESYILASDCSFESTERLGNSSDVDASYKVKSVFDDNERRRNKIRELNKIIENNFR